MSEDNSIFIIPICRPVNQNHFTHSHVLEFGFACVHCVEQEHETLLSI